jgi:hypothetical protein
MVTREKMSNAERISIKDEGEILPGKQGQLSLRGNASTIRKLLFLSLLI